MSVFKANTAAPGSHIWNPSVYGFQCVSACIAENQGMITGKDYELKSHLQLRECDLRFPAVVCHWIIIWTESNRCKLICLKSNLTDVRLSLPLNMGKKQNQVHNDIWHNENMTSHIFWTKEDTFKSFWDLPTPFLIQPRTFHIVSNI